MHRKLLRNLNQGQEDLNKLNATLKTLRSKYTLHKYQIFFIRYALMQRMIKSALERAQQALDDRQNQSLAESELERQEGIGAYFEKKRKIDEIQKYYSGKTA